MRSCVVVSRLWGKSRRFHGSLLGGVGLVVHEEEVEVTGVVDEESLVAGGHHVAGLLVAAVANLSENSTSATSSRKFSTALFRRPRIAIAMSLQCLCHRNFLPHKFSAGGV